VGTSSTALIGIAVNPAGTNELLWALEIWPRGRRGPSGQGLALAKAFMRIGSEKLRQQIASLVNELGQNREAAD
jgi:hypothetical protein